ncbi:MAG: DUF3387 domain-containing protein, partial [Microbacterium sp.]
VKARQVRKLFKALLPNPQAAAQQRTVAAVRVLHERIIEVTRPPEADISAVSDAVDALLDRSVGAEEYVIRAAAEGTHPDPLIDLSQIDFEGLAAKFAGRERAETDRLAQLLRQQAIGAAQRNPTRYELVERIEQLIADYNAGSLNIDEYLRRLIELSKTLTAEEERAVREGMSEEELAIFDLLTQPNPVLTDEERDTVKASARTLLTHLHEKLVQDWRLKVAATNEVNSTIRRILDAGLPQDPYTPEIFGEKVQLVFDHVLTAYGDDGESAYSGNVDHQFSQQFPVEYDGPVDVDKIADDVVERIHADPEFARHVAEQLGRLPEQDPL